MRSLNVKREAAVIALFIVLSIAMTWPLAIHLTTASGDDPLFTTWVLNWDHYATTHLRSLFDANIFYPAPSALAYSEHMYGLALLTLPLYLLGFAPLTIHNIALIAGFAATGYAMYLLARWITEDAGASIAAGIALAFIGIRFHHIVHLQYVWMAWCPLVLLGCLMLIRKPSWRNTWFLAAALTMNALTAMHYLVFGTLLAALTLLIFGFRRGATFWARAAVAFAIMAIVNAPFVIPYLRMPMHRDFAEVLSNSARWHDWFIPNLQSRLYGRFTSGDGYGHERTLFPGFVITGLALGAIVAEWWIVGVALATTAAAVTGFEPAAVALIGIAIVVWRKPALRNPAPAALLWLGVAAWGARGVAGYFHRFLYEHVPGFAGIRMPARWVLFAYVGLAILVAIGAKRVPATLVAALLLLELRAAPIRYFLEPEENRPVYAWLANQKLHGGVMELPMDQPNAYRYMFRATQHHQPLLNGVSSYTPAHYARLERAYNATPVDDSFMQQLETLHCSLVIVHGDEAAYRGDAINAWLKTNLASGRLIFVRRFEGRIRGDSVFAVARNERGWKPSQPPDPGRPVYNAEPFQHVEQGPAFEVIHGKVVVRGWAFAPAGVAHVNLRFANGSIVVPADRERRDDVRQQWPWYPNDPAPGFKKAFDAPLVIGDTDMQVEVIDRQGHRVRGLPFWFRWLPAQPRIAWNEPTATDLLNRLNVDATNRARVFSGSAAIEDFTGVLLRSKEQETDTAFVDRILNLFLGNADQEMSGALLRKLTNGVSRERIIESVVHSKAFAAKYYGVLGTKT